MSEYFFVDIERSFCVDVINVDLNNYTGIERSNIVDESYYEDIIK